MSDEQEIMQRLSALALAFSRLEEAVSQGRRTEYSTLNKEYREAERWFIERGITYWIDEETDEWKYTTKKPEPMRDWVLRARVGVGRIHSDTRPQIP